MVTTSGGVGRSTLEGGAGNELFEGNADGTTPSVGGDFIYGRAGNDDLYGNALTTLQTAIAPTGTAAIPTGLRGDWLNGGTGDDYIIGYTGNDVVLGGLGADLLVGGAGDDTLAGDTDYTSLQMDWTVTQGINVFFRAVGVINDENANEPLLSGGADVLYGGLGNDFLNGEAGNDLLFGEQGNDILAGGYENDILVGGAGNDTLTGDFGVRATIENQPIAHVDDYLDGGAGDDWLQGEGGNDILLGGAGNDTLWGDASYALENAMHGNDYLNGEAGNDYLNGGAGNDMLIGGADDDQLLGGDGDDILIGGPGLDVLVGGTGKDTYVFNRGDGTEIIDDIAADAKHPEASVLVLGDGISRSSIKFRPGSLMIDLGPSNPDDPLAGNDQIHFINFSKDFPGFSAAVGEIRFADGTVMDYSEILAQGFDIDGTAFDDAGGTALIGTAVTDRIRGFAGSDELEGRAGDDVLIGDGGSDRLDGGDGNDLLDGGAGNDLLAGGFGSDDYRFISGDGLDTIVEGLLFLRGVADPGSTDRIVFDADITRADVTLLRSGDGNLTVRYGAGDEILVDGQYSIGGSGIESIVFADGHVISKAELDALEIGAVEGSAAADELFGTAGSDVLRAYDSDDYLDGGPSPERRPAGARLVTGDDVLDGGTGSDTYALYWGMGNDRIIDATDGQSNTLTLLDGATLESVKTSRSGDDLLVAMRGGGGSALLEGFFVDGSAASWQITSTGRGQSVAARFVQHAKCCLKRPCHRRDGGLQAATDRGMARPGAIGV